MTIPSTSLAFSHSRWCAPLRSQASRSKSPSRNHIYETTTLVPRPSLVSANRTTYTGEGNNGRNVRGERRKRRRRQKHHCLRVHCFYPHQKQGRLCGLSTFRMHLRGCRGTGRTTAVRGCGIGVVDLCVRESVLSRLARVVCIIWFERMIGHPLYLYRCRLLILLYNYQNVSANCTSMTFDMTTHACSGGYIWSEKGQVDTRTRMSAPG